MEASGRRLALPADPPRTGVSTISDIEDGRSRRSGEEYVAAAVEMVDRFGSAYTGLGFTMVAAAETAGISRKALYRRWDSVTELTDDLARYGGLVRSGWGSRLLAASPSTSIGQAIADAMAERDLAPVIRAAASSWPVDNPARRDLVAWERQWFEVLAGWIDQRLAAAGRTYPEGVDAQLAALVLTAWLDGTYFRASWLTGPQLPEWEPNQAPPEFRQALRWFQRTFPRADGEPTPPAPATVPALPVPDIAPAKIPILEALLAAAQAPGYEGKPGPTAGRVVDLSRFARELDVSERLLSARWPQPADLNGPVFEFMLRRVRRESEEHLATALQLCFAQRFTSYDQMIISGLAAMLDATLQRAPYTHFSMVVATLDDDVRIPSAAFIEEWIDSAATSFLAMFALSGWRLRDGVTIHGLMVPLFATMLGLQRIGAMHPELAAETRTFRGREVPALAAAAYQFLLGAVTDQPYTAPDAVIAAPPLDPPDPADGDGAGQI